MKFNTSAEAFKFYEGMSSTTLEARAKAIESEIAGNFDCDLEALMHELEGIKEALEERDDNTSNVEKRSQMMPEIRMTGTMLAEEDVAGTREYRRAFYKTMLGEELTGEERNAFNQVEHRADKFGTLASSTSIIPVSTMDEIIKHATDQGGIYNLARKFNMKSYVKVPIGAPTATAQWHPEGQKVESEAVDTTDVQFQANEILKIISLSEADDIMTIDALESYIAYELNTRVMSCISQALVNGDGIGKGEGIETGVEWTEGSNLLTIDESDWVGWRDLLEAIALLHRGYARGASWVMNNATLYRAVYALCDDNNRPLYLADAKDGGSGYLLGHPVVIDDFVDDDTLYFGNFAYMGVNMPVGIRLDVSHESSFNMGKVDYRAFTVADSRVLLPDAFVKVCKGE